EWDSIEEIFHTACELRGESRSKFLDQSCGSLDMRRKVDALLQRDDQTAGFLDQSAAAMVTLTLAPGTLVGPYQILGIAGIGGMGQVYRAHDSRLQRTVAIKTLPAFANDTKRPARFELEARLLASLNHPNVAAIYDMVEVDGDLYLVLEF